MGCSRPIFLADTIMESSRKIMDDSGPNCGIRRRENPLQAETFWDSCMDGRVAQVTKVFPKVTLKGRVFHPDSNDVHISSLIWIPNYQGNIFVWPFMETVSDLKSTEIQTTFMCLFFALNTYSRVDQFPKVSFTPSLIDGVFHADSKNGLFSCLGQAINLHKVGSKFGLFFGSFERKGWTQQFWDKTSRAERCILFVFSCR